MISFRWTYLPVGILCFLVGLLIGIVWRLSYDQSSNLIGLISGLVLSVVAIAVSLWLAARERELRLGDIQRDIGEVKADIRSLRTAASEMWQPVMSALAGEKYGTSSQPVGLAAVQQEQSEPRPAQPRETGSEAHGEMGGVS